MRFCGQKSIEKWRGDISDKNWPISYGLIWYMMITGEKDQRTSKDLPKVFTQRILGNDHIIILSYNIVIIAYRYDKVHIFWQEMLLSLHLWHHQYCKVTFGQVNLPVITEKGKNIWKYHKKLKFFLQISSVDVRKVLKNAGETSLIRTGQYHMVSYDIWWLQVRKIKEHQRICWRCLHSEFWGMTISLY